MSGIAWAGTSGWSYDHWRGSFYPADLPRRAWFDFYASRFPAVEINATFYGLPAAQTVARWREAAPPGFVFAVKGSRLITHAHRLLGCEAPLATFYNRIRRLGPHLAVILWQLPPGFERDDGQLKAFLRLLPAGVRHAFEFRDPSWSCDATLSLLEQHNAALVAASSSALPAARIATADFVYARFHGLEGGYAHDYTTAELAPWAEWAREMAAGGRDGYFFFNNDGMARAPANASRFAAMLGEFACPWPARPA